MLVPYEEIDSSKTKKLIQEHKSFEITGLSGRMDKAITKIENIISNEGLTCRVYTYGRVASIGTTFIGGITSLVGIASFLGIASHNIVTFNPDYEIAKHIVDKKLSIKYKKKQKKK